VIDMSNVIKIARPHMPAIGDRLPNGATLLDYSISVIDDTEEGVYRYGKCLALMPTSGDKYVTWRLAVKPDGTAVTQSGHYFDRLLPALEDFECRR
jgi:hypothetical protein